MAMEVQLTPETEQKLPALATQSGRRTDDLVEDAMAGYLEEVAQVRVTLDSRYDDLKSGRVKPMLIPVFPASDYGIKGASDSRTNQAGDSGIKQAINTGSNLDS
jgi:predicted DNA-binding protein